jgi:hypothetical protein
MALYHTHTHTYIHINARTASELRFSCLNTVYNRGADFSKNLGVTVGDTKQVPYCGPTNIRCQLAMLCGPGDLWPGNYVPLA